MLKNILLPRSDEYENVGSTREGEGKRKGDCTRMGWTDTEEGRTHGAESYMERKNTVFTNNTVRVGGEGGVEFGKERGNYLFSQSKLYFKS